MTVFLESCLTLLFRCGLVVCDICQVTFFLITVRTFDCSFIHNFFHLKNKVSRINLKCKSQKLCSLWYDFYDALLLNKYDLFTCMTFGMHLTLSSEAFKLIFGSRGSRKDPDFWLNCPDSWGKLSKDWKNNLRLQKCYFDSKDPKERKKDLCSLC